MSAGPVTDHYDVVIVGGGQAGLALGYFLVQQGRRFTILEAAEESAAAWRSRWDSLKLFTPARYDALPGLAFPGDPDRYPGRDEVAAYLALALADVGRDREATALLERAGVGLGDEVDGELGVVGAAGEEDEQPAPVALVGGGETVGVEALTGHPTRSCREGPML